MRVNKIIFFYMFDSNLDTDSCKELKFEFLFNVCKELKFEFLFNVCSLSTRKWSFELHKWTKALAQAVPFSQNLSWFCEIHGGSKHGRHRCQHSLLCWSAPCHMLGEKYYCRDGKHAAKAFQQQQIELQRKPWAAKEAKSPGHPVHCLWSQATAPASLTGTAWKHKRPIAARSLSYLLNEHHPQPSLQGIQMNIWTDVAGRRVNYEINSAFLQESLRALEWSPCPAVRNLPGSDMWFASIGACHISFFIIGFACFLCCPLVQLKRGPLANTS